MSDFVKLLGCEHRLQRRCFSFSDDQKQTTHRQQQSQFALAVANMLIKEKFMFVGEEIGHQQESIVELMAQAFGIRFDKIDMPLPLRIKHGCGPLYSHEVSKHDFASGADWEADVVRCNGLREEYMYRRSLEFIQETKLPALIVCGLEHCDPLAKLFGQTAPEVVTLSIADFDWFDKRLYDWPTS